MGRKPKDPNATTKTKTTPKKTLVCVPIYKGEFGKVAPERKEKTYD